MCLQFIDSSLTKGFISLKKLVLLQIRQLHKAGEVQNKGYLHPNKLLFLLQIR